ncbi:MAG: class I SAM-dependent methyltransferase [Leptospiraceae bacterium]|nr:class I SAM-dependent methyltransferase [Leptospiraceae bacterium]MDW7976536.1 methyltransferase domain-containing protein [Leptospiraceae bacterium]
MRGLPYYENPEYHEFLLSHKRRELFPIDKIFSQIPLKGVQNLLDFGMGNGYFLNAFFEYGESDIFVWGAECQEVLIDFTLKRKVKENLKNFIPFHVEKTEHPLLPEWIPEMDMIFISCVLSTFANPTLGILGTGRILKKDGYFVILDWEKVELPVGPDIHQKVSSERMMVFIQEAGCQIVKKLQINPYVYGFLAKKDPDKFIDISYLRQL